MDGHGGHALVAAVVLAFAVWVALAVRYPYEEPQRLGGPPVRALAAASIFAGSAHAAATPHHALESVAYGVFFLAVTLGQFGAGIRMLRHGGLSPRLWTAAAAGNAAVFGLWVCSRTLGLPIGPHREVEAIGPLDLAASAAELLFVALLVACFALRPLARQPASARTPVGVRSAFPS